MGHISRRGKAEEGIDRDNMLDLVRGFRIWPASGVKQRKECRVTTKVLTEGLRDGK